MHTNQPTNLMICISSYTHTHVNIAILFARIFSPSVRYRQLRLAIAISADSRFTLFLIILRCFSKRRAQKSNSRERKLISSLSMMMMMLMTISPSQIPTAVMCAAESRYSETPCHSPPRPRRSLQPERESSFEDQRKRCFRMHGEQDRIYGGGRKGSELLS